MPKSWNMPEELVGGKQPLYNQVWWAQPKKVENGKKAEAELLAAVIVEGQGDAITLGSWGIQAVALVGDTIGEDTGNYLLSELKRKAEAGYKIIVGLDNDEDGLKKREKVIGRLMEAGLSAVQIGVVTWPVKDANEWLKQGATEENARNLVTLAPSALGRMIDDAAPVSGQRDDEAVRRLFGALCGLRTFDIENVRGEVCDRLQIRYRMFDGLLKAARRDAGQNDDGQARYFVEGGRIFSRFYDAQGGESIDPLCNFAATIKEDVLRDNGQEVIREFRIAGETGKKALPEARVLADEFSKMDWVLKVWGSRTIIEAGSRRKDQLRAAIQHLSREVERRTIYTHTGWRQMEGKRIYLTAAGAVGGGDVDVELDQDLELYNIPVVPDDPKDAMGLSLSYLAVAPDHISFPLWGAMWLPVVRELVNVAFTVWVFGGTGAMKSTYTALAMNHYGAAFDDKHLPSNFLDTANIMERKSFITKDAPLVIDDYAPQKDARSHSEYMRAAARIIRAAGNLSGRGRMTADAGVRTTYVPRSLVIITGEDLPELEGLVARLFVVEMKRGDVDKNKLTVLQGKRERLGHAMSGFLSWAAECWPMWTEAVPKNWRYYRQKAFEEGYHLRLPEAVAGLMLGAELGLSYARHLGLLDGEEYNALLERAWTAMSAGARTMADRVKDEKPEILFLRTLGEMLTQGKIFFSHESGVGGPLGGPAEHSEMLGWYDNDRVYLMPDATYNRIAKYYREQGNVFPVRQSTLRKMLLEAGYLEADPGRRTMSVNLVGQPRRVMVMKRKYLENPEE